MDNEQTTTAAISEPINTPLNEGARSFTPPLSEDSFLVDEHRGLQDIHSEKDLDSVPQESELSIILYLH